MAVYSVNQATHLYVLGAEPTNVAGPGYVRYSGLGANKDLATDLINKSKVLNVTNVKVNTLVPKGVGAVITLTGDEFSGEYILRVIIDNYFSASPSGSYIKHASAYITTTTDKGVLAEALVESLNQGLSRDVEKAFTAEVSDNDTIVIKPIAGEWKLGRMATVIPQIHVELVPKSTLSLKAEWGTVTETEGIADTDRKLASEILADYEYFCLGERGDQYRGIGWPNNVETKGEIDPTSDAYEDIVTVHYYEDLPNEAVQKSEKTVVFVCTNGIADAIVAAFSGATNTELDSRVSDLDSRVTELEDENV